MNITSFLPHSVPYLLLYKALRLSVEELEVEKQLVADSRRTLLFM